MEEKTITVYTYNELSDKAKEKARNYYQEHIAQDILDSFLNDYLYERLDELLKENNIIDNTSLQKTNYTFKGKVITKKERCQLQYSLGYCQGDGLQILGKYSYDNVNVNIKHYGHYYHNKCIDMYFYNNDMEDLDESDKRIEAFKDIYNNITKQLEKDGYEYIESEQSEESMLDYFNGNDIKFYKDGDIFYE